MEGGAIKQFRRTPFRLGLSSLAGIIVVSATGSLAGRVETAPRSRHPAAVFVAADSIARQRPDAARLEAALRQYRDIDARGDWPTLPSGPSLRAGDRDPSVPLIRHRLGMDAVAESDLFDATLEQAVHAFQVRHGLEADGIVGSRTRRAANVTAAERVRQLEINLARLRARSDSLPVPRIEVNIAAQMLRYFDPKGDVLEMRTIVGRRDWPTPIFEARVEAIVLAPYWNVPTRIAALEVIPAIRRDPGYLARNDMEVVTTAGARITDPATIDWSKSFPHRIRQRPGPRNPLGEVKFLLPNRFDVYLHDTPGRAAFQRADRALSHGCVRLERAMDLAAALLAGRPEGAIDAMRNVIQAGREHTIRLDHSVPVILYYQTAWVEGDGTVHFREDIYGHDRRAAPLAEPASHESECAAG